MEEAKKILVQGASKLGIDLSERQSSFFLTYLGELERWNKRLNLTSLSKDRDIVTRHFLDSLIPVKFLKGCDTILDIGSGAGFPGIPIKIALPGLNATLMEGIEKKSSFLRHIIRTLGLKDINVECARAEDKKTVERLGKTFDCVISRALSDIKSYLSLAMPYVKKGGEIIAIKGPAKEKLSKEVKEIKGYTYELYEENIPFTDRKTTIVLFHVEQ